MFVTLLPIVLLVPALVHPGTRAMASLSGLDLAEMTLMMKPQPCQFEPIDEELPVRLEEKLAISGVKLLRYNVSFVNYTDKVMIEAGGDLFRPNLWMRSVNREGTNLLMFDDNFEVFSMGLLGVGIEDMDIELIDRPRGCIHNLTAEERMTAMRRLLQDDFHVNSTDTEKIDQLDEQICNMRMYVPADEVNSGEPGARYTYTCCHNDNDVMECADIVENRWVTSLIQILKAIIVFLVLYSPKFVPRVYYEESEGKTHYTTALPEGCTVRIEKDNHECFILKQDDMAPMDGMPKAKETLETFGDGIYTCRVSDITFSVPRDKLLAEDSIPVSIPTMIYDNVFRCRMDNISPFVPCCTSSIYGEVFEERFDRYKIRWKECLQIFVKFLVFCLCLLPSIIQYVVYDKYIAPGIRSKELARGRINATFVHKSDFDILGLANITLHFYSVFIVILTAIVLEIYHHFIKRFVDLPKFSTHFVDMENQRFLPIFQSIIHLALVPFLKCGVFGLLIFPLFMIIVSFYTAHFLMIIFPLLNLISRLFLYPFLPMLLIRRRRFLEYFGIKDFCKDNANHIIKLDTISSSNKFLAAWYPYMAICLVFIIYLLVWLVDCVIFYAKVLFYTGIGIIANSNNTLPYVTVIILVGIYVNQIFGNVSTVYSEYSKTLKNVIISRCKSEYNELTRQSSSSGVSMAFFTESQGRKFSDFAQNIRCSGTGEPVYFSSKELFIFLKRTEEEENLGPSNDSFYEKIDSEVNEMLRIFTPEKLFLETIDMDTQDSPGPVWKNVLWACFRLAVVVVFLGFVVIVVMGLGDTYKISITNQLFLTVAGGLLPLIFRHVVSGDTTTASVVDAENCDLRLNLIQKLEKYSEDWEVADMTLFLVDGGSVEGRSGGGQDLEMNVIHSTSHSDGVRGDSLENTKNTSVQ